MRVDRGKVLAALVSWNGFREGPNNSNPFGPYQGIANAAYCESFADGEPHRVAGYDHRIGLKTGRCQFGAKGDAYTPLGVNHAKERGEWMADHASQGRPCDLLPGDQVFIAWNNGAGPEPDHVETVTAVYADGTYDTVGANTGRPEGVWHPIRRDRKYLLGRRRPHLYYAGATTPIPTPKEDEMPAIQIISVDPGESETITLPMPKGLSAPKKVGLSFSAPHPGCEARLVVGPRWRPLFPNSEKPGWVVKERVGTVLDAEDGVLEIHNKGKHSISVLVETTF